MTAPITTPGTAAPFTGVIADIPTTPLAIVPAAPPHHALAHRTDRVEFDAQQLTMLADTIMPGASAAELNFFALVCRRTNLDPFARQIHAVKRSTRRNGQFVDVWAYQVAIDGFRLIAERTGKYRGQTLPLFCGTDGVWREVWTAASAPVAAKVGVLRADFDEPLYAVALYSEYVQTVNEGGQKVPNTMWRTKATVMLAKVAEALALRKAFPQEMSGLYTDDEMGQADNDAANAPKRATRAAAQTKDGATASTGAVSASEQQKVASRYVSPFPFGSRKGTPLDATEPWVDGGPYARGGEPYVFDDELLDRAGAWAIEKARSGSSRHSPDKLLLLAAEVNTELERRSGAVDDSAPVLEAFTAKALATFTRDLEEYQRNAAAAPTTASETPSEAQ